AGIASAAPLVEVARQLDAFAAAAAALGSRLARPILPLQTLTFQAIPALRLTPRGLLDVKSRAIVPAVL
ncbi:MAG: adenine deaminase C-terminal domain-containing protein, partial [Candidatus Rokuibacteriota bacterium]